MKTTVIYHSADFDGIFCREIARKFLSDAELIGWNFGDPPLPIPTEGAIYIMDLPPDKPFGLSGPVRGRDGDRVWDFVPANQIVVWIDHHRTSIEEQPADLPGYRIDGVAACRLAWQWFSGRTVNSNGEPPKLASKHHYIDRIVSEPLAVRLAGEYDIWDKRDPRAETFQYGLMASEINFEKLLGPGKREIFPSGTVQWIEGSEAYVDSILKDGQAVQRYAQNVDASICKSRTWLMEWEGLKFLCVNSARFNSLFFAAKDVPETGHDALLGFCFDGKCWTVSLYHAKHRTDLDLSVIAKKHGGGGHKGACGFTCKTLPFSL